MKAENIRKMTDKELYSYLNRISNQNGRICCKCGAIVFKEDRITLLRNINITTKKYVVYVKNVIVIY